MDKRSFREGKTVRVWTRDGWVRRLVEDDEKQQYQGGVRSRVAYDNDVNWNGPRGEMDLIQDVHNEIMYGPVGLHIDELPNNLRDIVQQPYVWHIANTRLFKIIDPESQIAENGDWGSDRTDQDTEVLEEHNSTTRMFLEQAGILPADAETEEVTDILGSVTDGSEVTESPYGHRIDMDVQHISIMPSAPDCILMDEVEFDEAKDVFTEDDVVMCKSRDGALVPIPQLPSEAVDNIHLIREEFLKLLPKATTPNEQELLKLQYEQALDREVGRYITCSMNSPYCGHGYTPPRRMHKFIPTPKDSAISIAAEERISFFHEIFGEAASCESMDDLHGRLVVDDRTIVDGQPNPNYGRRHRPGGFMGKIRGMYQHDKELAQEWSVYDKTDKEGKVVQRSAFNLAREAFIRDWREKQKGDEESLRITVWVMFDREAREVPAIRDEKTGLLVSPARRYKDSIWRQKRTKALQDLFLTRKQWDAIYSMVGIIKRRMKLVKESTQERIDTLETLRAFFEKVQNLSDLNSYMKWAQRRIISKAGRVYPSKLDKLSMLDESRWRQSCAKKRRFLIGRIVLFNQLRKQVKSSKPTQLGEQFLTCLDPECNCMAIDQPTWYELQEDKGLLGIRCDGCGKIVWCIGYKDKPELMTYEEASNGH